MASNNSSQTTGSSETSNSNSAQSPQPLSQKSHEQLKRETRARLRHLDPITASELLNESAVGKQVGGFVSFLREHAIVGLAVGFVLATQVQTVVKQLINSFIEPLFQLITGNENLNNLSVKLHFNGHTAPFGWGAFVYALIDFIFVALTIYVIIRLFNLDKLDKTK
jgi:large conductance mechanosensitive channel